MDVLDTLRLALADRYALERELGQGGMGTVYLAHNPRHERNDVSNGRGRRAMNKIRTGWKLPPLALPVALLGANVYGKPNFLTIAWFNMLESDPPLIGASMSKTHYTMQGVKANKTFSLNVPSSAMAQIVDYCGLHSGWKVDKSRLFEVFYGELETAPMVRECALNMECRLVDSKDLNTTALIMGEIVGVYSEEEYLTEGRPDLRKMDPMMFFMPLGPYIKAGDVIAKAFEVGKDHGK